MLTILYIFNEENNTKDELPSPRQEILFTYITCNPKLIEVLIKGNIYDIIIIDKNITSEEYDTVKGIFISSNNSPLIAKILPKTNLSCTIHWIQKGVRGLFSEEMSWPDLVDALYRFSEEKAYLHRKLIEEVFEYWKIFEIKDQKTAKLKPQSKKILRLLKRGYSYQEIADELQISINVVRYYIKDLYRALGVKNKLAAIDQATT